MLGLGELVQLELFYRALRVPSLSGLQVLGVKKGEAFLSWYVRVSEFQSSPNWGTWSTRLGKLSEMHH